MESLPFWQSLTERAYRTPRWLILQRMEALRALFDPENKLDLLPLEDNLLDDLWGPKWIQPRLKWWGMKREPRWEDFLEKNERKREQR